MVQSDCFCQFPAIVDNSRIFHAEKHEGHQMGSNLPYFTKYILNAVPTVIGVGTSQKGGQGEEKFFLELILILHHHMVHANFHKGGGGHGPPPFPLPTPMRQMKGPLLLKASEMDSERKTGLENALFKQN